MGYDQNKVKSDALGMNFNTARQRLVKSILFLLITETGRDSCHQCGDKIEKESELSIEHKIPWLNSDNPVGLYFDLDNISFSHLICNTKEGAQRKSEVYRARRFSEDGSKRRCSSCKELIQLDRFSRSSHGRDGYAAECLDCRNITKRDRRSRGMVG